MERFQEIFQNLLNSSPKNSLAEKLNLVDEAGVSFFLDASQLQDSFRYRARRLGLKIAERLINENGDLEKAALADLRKLLSKGHFCLGPKREGDALIYEHLSFCLEALESDPALWPKIRKFSPPLCHKRAEDIIKDTLWPEPVRKLLPYHVRRAALAAWLTWLRQTTGSCFATAPAILIQKKPHQFFKDLDELLSMGQFKRVFGGQEYAVPLAPNLGTYDLTRQISHPERLCYAPSLILALEAAQVLPSGVSFPQKIEILRKKIGELPAVQSPEQVIKQLIIDEVGLSHEEIEDEEYLAKIQMAPLLASGGALYYQKPSERAQKVAEMKKRLKMASGVFLSFADCALLRAWEYSLASFSDIKVDFARWNLYVGLGLHHEAKGGIGAYLYRWTNEKIRDLNEEITRSQREYEEALYTVRSLEALLQRSSDAQSYAIRTEMAGAVAAVQAALDIRTRAEARGAALVKSYAEVMRFYDQKLQEYFQEVFDPTVMGEEEHLYEDSPAGFRMVYKHGRSDASLWTQIQNGDQYIRSLREFFSLVESEIPAREPLGSEFQSEITSAIIQFIQEPEFLEGARERSKAMGRRTPWDYVSGGTMQVLVQTYCSRSSPATEISLLPKSEEDLLKALLGFKREKHQPLLIHSPTHAFILHLDWLPERALSLVEENRNFMGRLQYDAEMQEHIAHSLSEKLSSLEAPLFLHLFRKAPTAQSKLQLRMNLLDSLKAIPSIRAPETLLDSHLYEKTPLFDAQKGKQVLDAILKSLCQAHGISCGGIAQESRSYLGAYDLVQMVKKILLESLRTPISPVDWDVEIAKAALALKVGFPNPILFADTNWSSWVFGFVVNPLHGKLELWRLNRTGSQGFPMTDWKAWFSLENQSPWVILPHPDEYS
jgi:hypothetical protein